MDKFKTLTSACIPVRDENVDTDQIMPGRFLISVTKTGYGDKCFYDWRFNEDGSEKKDSILNDPKYKGHKILVAGHNFGCGSSREHAVWGLVQYGFKVVISSKFADIFRNNALKNGLLVITVSPDDLSKVFEATEADPEFQLTVDLENQQIQFPDGYTINFDIEPFWRECIMKGMDDTAYILSLEDKIKQFEKDNNK